MAPMVSRSLCAAASVAILWAMPALAQLAIDGDTLRIGAERVRLVGIDAPEMRQPCDAGRWHPGPIAADELARLMAGHRIECRAEGRDRYRRTLATCFADGADLGAAMVASGWAWAFRRYSLRYVPAEERAAALALGIHSHDCEQPSAYRARMRQQRQEQAKGRERAPADAAASP